MWVKNIQTAGYNGAHTVTEFFFSVLMDISKNQWRSTGGKGPAFESSSSRINELDFPIEYRIGSTLKYAILYKQKNTHV